jgi:hypothetical protein
MLKACLVAFSTIFLGSFAILTPSDAEGAWFRRHGSACATRGTYNVYQATWINANGVFNVDSSRSLSLACPIPEDDRLTLSSINYTYVDVDIAPYGSSCAYRCWTYWSSNGGSCNPSYCWSSGGFEEKRTLQPTGAFPSGVFAFLVVDLSFYDVLNGPTGVCGYRAGS